MLATLERWHGGRSDEQEVRPTLDAIRETIRKMSGEMSATLTLETDGRELLNGSCGGRFIATALLDDDNIFDLVGDPSSDGRESFRIGGQDGDVLRRHLVSSSAVIQVAMEFINTGTIDRGAGWWEHPDSYDIYTGSE